MQLAGKKCALCEQSIALETEGTWCARCGVVAHRGCLDDADDICPVCKAVYDKPENYFAYSEQCPDCLNLNLPPADRCVHCGAVTRWDTAKELDDFAAERRAIASRLYNRGEFQFLFGVCLAVLFFFMVYQGIAARQVSAPYLLLLGAFWSVVAGTRNMAQNRALRTFR
jgi:hypothetical protein